MIEQTKTLPVSGETAYDFFLDVSRWHEWTPFQLRDADRTTLSDPGDETRIHYRPFRIPIAATAILADADPARALTVSIRLPGTVPIRIHVGLRPAGTGAVLAQAVVDFEIPGGEIARSLWRMSIVPVVVGRDLRHSLDAAHGLLAAPLLTASEPDEEPVSP